MIRRLIGTFGYQGIPLVISLVQVPLLLSIVGITGYGQIQYLTMISMVFLVIMDFGSNDFFFKKIGEVRSDPNGVVSDEIERLILVRCMTAACGFTLSLGLLFVASAEIILFCVVALLLSLTPTWIFFVIDKFHILNLLQIVFRSLNLLVLYLVLTADNFLIVFPLTLGVTLLVINMLSYAYIWRYSDVRPRMTPLRFLGDVREMGQVFLGKFFLRIYWFLPYLYLRSHDPEALGLYSLLDRLGQVLRTLPDGISGYLLQRNTRDSGIKRVMMFTAAASAGLFGMYVSGTWVALEILKQTVSLTDISLYAGGFAVYAMSSVLANRFLVMNNQYLSHLLILMGGIVVLSAVLWCSGLTGWPSLMFTLVCVLFAEICIYAARAWKIMYHATDYIFKSKQ